MKIRIDRFEDLRDNEKFSFIRKSTGKKFIGYQLKSRTGDSILVYYSIDILPPPYPAANIAQDILNDYYLEAEREDKIKYRNS